MTFIVTLIALLVERFFDWSHLRKWTWFHRYEHKIATKMQGKSPYLALAVVILTPVLLVFIISVLLHGRLYGLLSMLFQLCILLYCLGPKNLWAGMFAQINTLKDFRKPSLKPETSSNPSSLALQQEFLSNIFIEANRRVFAVVFWFILLGATGAILYRTISLVSNDEQSDLRGSAHITEGVLDWLPVRIFTFLFALGGHFAQVLSMWRKYVLLGLAGNEILLTECGVAALGSNPSNSNNDNEEKHAISLLDRVFIITLVIIAIGALIL